MDLIVNFQAPAEECRRIPLGGMTAEVGREDNAHIRLDHPGVSRRHARILLEDEKALWLEDWSSANGTTLDGISVRGKTRLHSDQTVGVGPFRFTVCLSSPSPEHPSLPPACLAGRGKEQTGPSGMPADPGAIPAEEEDRILRRAVEELPELVGKASRGGNPAQVSREAEKVLYTRILQLLPPGSGAREAEGIVRKALTRALGLGPLEEWLQDPAISEIMVNGSSQTFVEVAGCLEKREGVFESDGDILRVMERILAPLGRRLDEASPYVDARLPDGSRVNAIIRPVSLGGPVMTIRKFPSRRLDIRGMVEKGSLTEEGSAFLAEAVRRRRNILVSGGTGTGKTTFLNALTGFIPHGERLITIEDSAELSLQQVHVIRLETRPPNMEGKGEVTMRDLVRNSLRMRPDRIIVGECRGGEALDMLQAMNTGHEGSMTTCHANTPRDALNRVETMALMSGVELPHKVVREQVAGAIHIIVQLARFPEGRRVVSSVVEIDGMEGENILTQELFRFSREGKGSLVPTGLVPAFLRKEGRP